MLGNVQDLSEQRRLILEDAATTELLFAPGTDFAYSNTGFIVAGAIAERLGGEPWETLLQQRVFEPLGIANFGYGAPGTAELVDQPWGHRATGEGLAEVPPDDPEHQLPPIFHSAGGVHVSLADWASFATDHLRGSGGGGALFSQEIYQRLQTPPGNESGFAMGWGALVEDGQVAMLTHNGSDGNWFADIRVYPPTETIFLMVTNDGREDGAAKAAFNELRAVLNDLYQPIQQ